MILDACSGNRRMWADKDPDDFVFIDMERKLAVPPSVFADNRFMPFKEDVFHTVFFDPPHGWGLCHPFYVYPDRERFSQQWPERRRGEIPRYYGWDKFKDRSALVSSIVKALKELRRVLINDGLLWFKWNESRIALHQILSLFSRWNLILKIPMTSNRQRGNSQTYWCCFQKQ